MNLATVKDPVCGMNVIPVKAKGGSATHAGHEYWFGILLSPMIASAAMSLSSVSVITNALRLRSGRL